MTIDKGSKPEIRCIRLNRTLPYGVKCFNYYDIK